MFLKINTLRVQVHNGILIILNALLPGITSETIKLPSTISEEELLDRVHALNNNPNVDGIIVQLPVPKHISERKVIDLISCFNFNFNSV